MKALLFLAVFTTAQACIWDRDTIAMEKARFPEAADILVGKFPRHSPDFYQWRKQRTEALLEKEPNNAALYDDLAVAQHKLGDHKGAIATMMKKEAAVPGRYETYSNLGTFYIYTGELDEALRWIDKALSVNPNAHFGREKYQRWLVEWAKAGKPDTGPEANGVRMEIGVSFRGFARFVAEKTAYKGKAGDWKAGRAEALKGMLGMMRFADFDNPLLLEALGDVLTVGALEENASHLASRAYLLANRRSKADAEKERLWKKMESAGSTHERFVPLQATQALDAALTDARTFVAKVWADEKAWIAKGADVEAEFEKKYLTPAKK
jgi:tetratricopeptide (TPR) repeat protein